MAEEATTQQPAAQAGTAQQPVVSDPAALPAVQAVAAPRRARSKRGSLRARLFSREAPWFVYLGLFFIVVGFAALAFTWSKVAGTLSVALQIPYIASGGLAGLGLVIVGIALTNIAVKRRDAVARERTLQKLSATMESIAGSVAGGRDATSVDAT